MASLYKRKKSPYFWLKFKDSAGRIKQVSTKCRYGIAPEVGRARRMAAEKSLAELSYGPTGGNAQENWECWVDSFLNTTYGASGTGTLERYRNSWRCLSLFFKERKVFAPNMVTRKMCFEYVGWRTTPNLKNGKYKAGRNSALLDLKILRIIMNEAVERDYCQGNPCVKLKIKRARGKVKPEYAQAHIDLIRQKIAQVKDDGDQAFFSLSFEIAYHQGCRLAETSLNPMTDVDLTAGKITFRIKGNREHVTMLHPKLVPLFERLRSERRTITWRTPDGAARQWPSIRWYRFLQKCGIKAALPGACFHSLRVTASTNMARAKVPENLAMQYIGHASTTVQRGYQRIRPEDLSDCANAIL